MFSYEPTPAVSKKFLETDFILGFHKVSGQSDQIVTRHEVVNNQIQLGQYVDHQDIVNILSNTESKRSFNILPEAVLFNDNSTMVWHTKSFESEIFFRDTKPFKVTYPSFVYVLDKKKNRLSIFAKTSNARPTMETLLYHAPLCNVYKTGILCQGNATLDIKDIDSPEDCMRAAHDSLFFSIFTHINHSNTFRHQPRIDTSDHIKIWRNLKGNKPKAKDMVRLGKLREIIRL